MKRRVGRSLAWYSCRFCGQKFQAQVYERRRGRARYCSYEHSTRDHVNRGSMRRPDSWDFHPELVEFIALLYPDTSNADIAAVTGLTYAQVRNLASFRGLRKSAEWLRANRLLAAVGPEDPLLREVWAAQRRIKATITKRSKELLNGR